MTAQHKGETIHGDRYVREPGRRDAEGAREEDFGESPQHVHVHKEFSRATNPDEGEGLANSDSTAEHRLRRLRRTVPGWVDNLCGITGIITSFPRLPGNSQRGFEPHWRTYTFFIS